MTAAELVNAVADLPPEELPAVLTAIAARLASTARTTAMVPAPPVSREPDRWLTAEQAGVIAGVSKKVVYDWARGRPWASRPSRRCLRISEKGFRGWLDKRS